MARPDRLVLAESAAAAAAAEFGVSVDSGSSGLAAGVVADADGVDTVAAGVLAACKVCMGKAFSKSFPILKHPFDKFFIRGTRLLAGRTLSVGFQNMHDFHLARKQNTVMLPCTDMSPAP